MNSRTKSIFLLFFLFFLIHEINVFRCLLNPSITGKNHDFNEEVYLSSYFLSDNFNQLSFSPKKMVKVHIYNYNVIIKDQLNNQENIIFQTFKDNDAHTLSHIPVNFFKIFPSQVTADN